jgi:hypothetical protein
MREWRYNSTILDLGTRWVISFTLQSVCPQEKVTDSHSIGGCVCPRAGMDAVE